MVVGCRVEHGRGAERGQPMARTKGALAGALASAASQLEEWRDGHAGRQRIPEGLWRRATELAREYGVHRTAQALRLDYYCLKRRVGGGAAPGSVAVVERPAFVEILGARACGGTSGCLVEIEDGRGATMRVRLEGGSVSELAALGRVFLGRRT
jgi:hypothetical protein